MGGAALARSAIPAGVAVALLAMGVVPVAVAPGAVTALALAVAAFLLFWPQRAYRVPADRRVIAALVLVWVTVLWLLIRAALAWNPAVSVVGAVGLSAGAAVWVAAAAWFSLATVTTWPVRVRDLLAVVSGTGTLFAVSVWLEWARSGGQRLQGSAAGLFENSMSLGGYLAVASIASLAWALSSRSTQARVAGYCATGICVSGLYAASSRTGALGLLTALLFAWLLTGWRSRSPWILSTLVLLASLVSTVVIVSAAAGAFGDGARLLESTVGTSRDSIYRSALALSAQSPWVGRGPQQFTAVIDWQMDARGGFGLYATSDPHNMTLTLLLAGGVIALLLAAASSLLVLAAIIEKAASSDKRWPAALVASIPVAALAVGSVAWLSPATMLVVAVLTGAALRGPHAAEQVVPVRPKQSARAAVMPLAAITLIVGLGCLYALPRQYSYSRLVSLPAGAYAAMEAERLYHEFPDPGFAFVALNINAALAAEEPAAVDRFRRLARAVSDDARWSADMAGFRILNARSGASSESEAYGRVVAAVTNARSADPSTGLWDAYLALAAKRAGLESEAVAHEQSALRRCAGTPQQAQLLAIFAEGE